MLKHSIYNYALMLISLNILTLSSCGTAKNSGVHSTVKNTNIIRAVFEGVPSEGDKNAAITKSYRVVVDFTGDTAELHFEDKTYELDIYRTASGYGYARDGVDLRGKGDEATLTMPDGRQIELIDSELNR